MWKDIIRKKMYFGERRQGENPRRQNIGHLTDDFGGDKEFYLPLEASRDRQSVNTTDNQLGRQPRPYTSPDSPTYPDGKPKPTYEDIKNVESSKELAEYMKRTYGNSSEYNQQKMLEELKRLNPFYKE